jgi:20S proteasome alpha/beta subunit
MTLILSIPAKDAIVLASDGQVTSGVFRFSGEKLFRLNKHCAWAGSGELALIQRMAEAIVGISADQPLSDLRDQLANAIKQSVNTLLQLDFRTPFFQGNPQAMLGLHPGDFLFVECRSKPVILHIMSHGTPEWIDRPYATGGGESFAYALLQKYQGVSLTKDQASTLAIKVIEEAIEIGAYGLGPPIHLWQITPSGIDALDEEKIALLSDTANSLREDEVQLLCGEAEREVSQKPEIALPRKDTSSEDSKR